MLSIARKILYFAQEVWCLPLTVVSLQLQSHEENCGTSISSKAGEESLESSELKLNEFFSKKNRFVLVLLFKALKKKTCKNFSCLLKYLGFWKKKIIIIEKFWGLSVRGIFWRKFWYFFTNSGNHWYSQILFQ